MRQTLRYVPRILALLLILAAVAACSRAPAPEPEASSDTPAVVVIATDEPPPPEQPPERPVEFALDDRNEDPADKPNRDLTESLFADPSDNESPWPNTGSNASGVGMGGGVGGGGGRGGSGGFLHRRAYGGGGVANSSAAPRPWLCDHQNREGFWSAKLHDDDTTRAKAEFTHNIEFVKPGDPAGDVGLDEHNLFVTSLSILNLTGLGYDHKGGENAAVLRQAALWLRKTQANSGCFADPNQLHHLRAHAVATMAIAELYGISGDAVLKPILDRAVEYLLSQQKSGSGWGDSDADLLTTTWTILALKTSSMAGLTVPATAYTSAHKFLDQLAYDKGGYPTARYAVNVDATPRPEGAGKAAELPLNEAMWMVSSLLSGGRTVKDADVRTMARVLVEAPYLPEWKEGKLDFLHMYFASLALFQMGGQEWKAWEKPMSETLLKHQRGHHEADKAAGRTSTDKLAEHGSWDAVDAWSPTYGRVYSTAINTLSLQVYFRHQRLESNPPTDKDKDDQSDPRDAADFAHASNTQTAGGLQARRNGQMIGEFPLKHTGVAAKVSGSSARTVVTQTFSNTFDSTIEAHYTFPLPGDSAVNGFVMQVGARRTIGIVRPRAEAIEAYRDAKARGYTASLLTQQRSNVFTQHVANIPIGGEVKVELTYVQALKFDKGHYEYMFPMTMGPRYRGGGAARSLPAADADRDPVADPEDFDVRVLPPGMRSGMDIDVSIEIDAGVPIDIARTCCLSHEVVITMQRDGRAVATLTKVDAVPNRDFVLRWAVAGEKPAVAMTMHGGEYLNLQVLPQVDPRLADITPREITFILDNSGSMSGMPAQMSRRVIESVLNHLQPDDIFNIIYFSGTNAQVFEAPVANTPENIAAAKEYLGRTSPGGGTEMLDGLQRALDAKHDPRYLQIYAFLTDGLIYTDNEVMALVSRHADNARFFAFGTHSAPNRKLIDGIARHGRGKAIYCVPRNGTWNEEATQEFFDAIDRPVLCDISIDWNTLRADDVYPSRLDDVFAGQPVGLHARVSGKGKHTIYVNGRVGITNLKLPVEIDLGAAEENPAVAATWARLKIADLEEQLLLKPDDAVLIDEITQTSIRFGLMSKYTAFVAVDESRVTADGRVRSVWQPVEMPEGMGTAGDAPLEGKAMRIAAWGLWLARQQSGGVVVVKVEDGSAAARAGMVPGQVIRKVGGVTVRDVQHLESLLLQAASEVEIETTVNDEGEIFDATFKLPRMTE